MAKLYFRYSAMGAGKSLDLLKVAYNYIERDQKVILFNSALDQRYETGIIKSRTGLEKPAIPVTDEFDIVKYISTLSYRPDCLLFDEAQFLTKEQVIQMTAVVDEMQIPIICYGLRSDFRGEPFEGSKYLMVLADNIEEIKTICHCGKKATMNMRIRDGKAIYTGEQIMIGGNESYVSVCRKHWKEGDVGKNG
jgi:thymidine kinase